MWLVFEQIVKRRACIIGTRTTLARRFLFQHHTHGIKGAVVALVFGRDSGGNRLIAFEAAGRVEVFALFAGVKVEPALRTLPERVREILQQRAAFGAAGDGPGSWHVDGPRPERILFFRGRRLPGLSLPFRSRAGILVAVLPVLAVGHKMPPEKRLILRLWRVPHKSFFKSFELQASSEPVAQSSRLLARSRLVRQHRINPLAVNCLSHIGVLPSDKQRNGGGSYGGS
jgi:hypothetical protein